MNARQGVSVMWNTFMLLPGMLLAPVTLLVGPQASLTVLMTAGFAGSAFALMAVLRRWGASMPAAALGGGVYGFSPALIQSSMGHYDLQFAVLPPLIAHAALSLVTGRSRRYGPGSRPAARCGALLGLLAAAQVFIAEELLFETGVAIVIMTAVVAASRPRLIAVRLREVAAGLGVAGAVAAVIAGYPRWVQFFGPLRQQTSPFTPDFFKKDLAGFVQPSSLLLLHTIAAAAHQEQRGVCRQLPGSPPGVPRLPGLAPARRAGLGDRAILAAAAGAGDRHRVRGPGEPGLPGRRVDARPVPRLGNFRHPRRHESGLVVWPLPDRAARQPNRDGRPDSRLASPPIRGITKFSPPLLAAGTSKSACRPSAARKKWRDPGTVDMEMFTISLGASQGPVTETLSHLP
jgi:hypothetical protein